MDFIWLFFAHTIGDIALQSDWMAQNKSKYGIVMFWHVSIWTACICIAMKAIGHPVLVWQWMFLMAGHFSIDIWKCNSTQKFPSWHLYVDQALHLIQCLFVWVL